MQIHDTASTSPYLLVWFLAADRCYMPPPAKSQARLGCWESSCSKISLYYRVQCRYNVILKLLHVLAKFSSKTFLVSMDSCTWRDTLIMYSTDLHTMTAFSSSCSRYEVRHLAGLQLSSLQVTLADMLTVLWLIGRCVGGVPLPTNNYIHSTSPITLETRWRNTFHVQYIYNVPLFLLQTARRRSTSNFSVARAVQYVCGAVGLRYVIDTL